MTRHLSCVIYQFGLLLSSAWSVLITEVFVHADMRECLNLRARMKIGLGRECNLHAFVIPKLV